MSVGRAHDLGCSTMQIFSHNPRQWLTKDISEIQAEEFKDLSKKYDITPVFIHSSYLINLCSQTDYIYQKSVQLLAREMDLADLLGAEYVILHTGSASYVPSQNARLRAVEAFKEISKKKSWQTRLLLENTAGKRGDISSSIADLAEIMKAASGDLIGGICLDSCHAFQAGYNLSKEDGISKLTTEIERYLGCDSIKLIHLNDSKRQFNSGIDRHEHIGMGAIGLEGLRMLVNHHAFVSIPLVLETPKKNEDDDPRNLKIVRDFLLC